MRNVRPSPRPSLPLPLEGLGLYPDGVGGQGTGLAIFPSGSSLPAIAKQCGKGKGLQSQIVHLIYTVGGMAGNEQFTSHSGQGLAIIIVCIVRLISVVYNRIYTFTTH